MGWLKCGLGSVGRHSGAVDWLTGGGLCQRRELGGLRMGMAKVCFGEWGRHFLEHVSKASTSFYNAS